MMTVVFITLMTLATWTTVALTAAVAVRFERRRLTYRFKGVPKSLRDDQLPTVSICVPARNETHAMTECLERLLASDYQRLEIIVLDDSSVDNTSMLIKSFAHAGVRFVEGSALPDDWLGKNHALQGLLDEASGRYLLYLDVDTIVMPSTVRQLVEYTVAHQLPLVSVVPQRVDGLRASVFLGTLRYFWTILCGTKKKPAVSGAAWFVDRQLLEGIGGFRDYRLSSRPEVYIAARLSQTAGSQLVISTKQLGISYEKKWSSQVETSIRLLTPQFGSIPRVLLTSIVTLLVAILPVASVVIGIMQQNIVVLIAGCAGISLITVLSLLYYKAVWRYGWWLGAFHWPYVLVQEIILMWMSAYKYARGLVTWKGRPIIRVRSSKTTSSAAS